MQDKDYNMKVALKKAERTLDLLGVGPVSLAYQRLTEESLRKDYSSFEREYFGLAAGEEIVTVVNAVDSRLMYVVDVSADSVLTAMAETWALIAKKF